jgi:hypothetical protein
MTWAGLLAPASGALSAARCFEPRAFSILTAVLVTGAMALALWLVKHLVRRYLEPRLLQVSAGGVWVAAAFGVLGVYLFFLLGAAFSAQSSVEALFLRYTGVSIFFPEIGRCLGSGSEPFFAAATPLFFFALLAVIHLLHVLVAFGVYWVVTGPGVKGPAAASAEPPALMEPIAPALGNLLFHVGYYLDLNHVEARYQAYFHRMVLVLRVAKWLTLPAAFFGTLPAALWIVTALVVDSLAANLRTQAAPPPAKPPEVEAVTVEEPKPESRPVTPLELAQAVAALDTPPRFELRPVGEIEAARPGRLAGSPLLADGPVMSLISRQLGLSGSLYAHQVACETRLREGESVLLATAPLSGRATLGDLVTLHRVFVGGHTVMVLCPTAEAAAERCAALHHVVEQAGWRWSFLAWDLCHPSPAGLDLELRQPAVLFLTPEKLHAELLPNARDWDFFLRSLDLLVVTDLDRYTGAAGANLYRLSRRFLALCRRYRREPQVLGTILPYGPDVRTHAERLLGVKLAYVGPGQDTAPSPSRAVFTCRPLPGRSTRGSSGPEIPDPILVAGRVAGLGLRAELRGFESSLTQEDRDRVSEVLLQHDRTGPAASTRGGGSGAGAHAPGRRAEVVVAEVSAAEVRLLPELTRHYGADLVEVAVKLQALPGAEPPGPPRKPGFDTLDPALGVTRESFTGQSPAPVDEPGPIDDPEATGPQGDPEITDQPVTAATIYFPADEPLVHLLLGQGLVGEADNHPYLQLGCALVTCPDNEETRRKHLHCAMAETAWSHDALVAEFGQALVDAEVATLESQGSLVRQPRRELDPQTGLVTRVEILQHTGHPLPHGHASLQTMSAAHVTVQDRHTRQPLFDLDRVRGLADAYPGLVFVADGRRYRICPPEEQVGQAEGLILADPCERRVVTSKLRVLDLELCEPDRRTGRDRRQEAGASGPSERRQDERRAPTLHSLGGEAFHLDHPWVYLHETIQGLKTYDPVGRLLEATDYAEPIETRYRTRAAVLSLQLTPEEPAPAVMNTLVHVFRHVLPAFLKYHAFDLDIEYLTAYGPEKLASVAFIDRHPGGAGFARAVSIEVLRHVFYFSHQLLTRCPGGCSSNAGSRLCLRAEPGGGELIDRAGAGRVMGRVVPDAGSMDGSGASPQ